METLQEALQHHQAGRLVEAEALYRQILDTDPEQPEALHWLGVIELQQGQPQTAVELIQQALKVRPTYAEACNNLGLALQAQQRLPEAEQAFRRALGLEPDDVDIQLNLGLVLSHQDKFHEAVTAFERARMLDPDDPAIQNHLGLALQAVSRLPEAITAFERAVAVSPNFVDAQRNLAAALSANDRLGAAVQAYRQLLTLRPDFVGAHLGLGFALNSLGHIDDAAAAFREALRLKPDSINARRGLVLVLQMLRPASYEPLLEADLKSSFAAPEVDAQALAGLAANQLVHKYKIGDRFRSDLGNLLAELGSDALLLTLLTRTVNVDRELEQLLTELRRTLLFVYLHVAEVPGPHARLIAAIGMQCFNNEHVFNVAQDEDEAIAELRTRCEQLIAKRPSHSQQLEQNLSLLAMYVPLYTLASVRVLGAIPPETWSSPMCELIQRTLDEPLQEEKIESKIESLGDITDPTSRAVRAQYEEHPYPRWLELPRAGSTNLYRHLREIFPHFDPPGFLGDHARVLVAGCGTGREPISMALACKLDEIVAMDLSRRSLAYAIRMARKLGVDNVRFLHGDILALSQLKQHFHMIECAGVLHHMDKPVRGWQVLVESLVPGGLMRIGLYSERARRAEGLAREEIQRRGLGPSNGDIKTFRTGILRGEGAKSILELADGQDFYTLSACRDLLFHEKEHRFTVPLLQQTLKELNLSFIGFELPSSQLTQRYRELFPEDRDLTDLSNWERFESEYPQAFAGMYVFWCQKV
jgi:Tfp pilus assembly protein PilF/2-polyprenyl-3-methyl-5-hydroxy-6-metoxy-1,4-benzoquinol methylase